MLARCNELDAALDKRIAEFSADQKRHLTLQAIANSNLSAHVDEARSASLKLAGAVEPLIAEKLQVLQSTGAFVDKLEAEKEVQCPACGRSISVDGFREHIKDERERLRESIAAFETRKASFGTLCDAVKSLKSNVGKFEVKAWREELSKGALADSFSFLGKLNPEVFRTSCSEEDLGKIENRLIPLVNAAAAVSKEAPPDVSQLSTDRRIVEPAKIVFEAKKQAQAVKREQALVAFVNLVEQRVREEIRLRSQKVISEISADIQAMWSIFHPDKAIEDVRLYFPADADKAIDVALKFYGIDQDSPRLTLSEGYRNSLGLCIFLAMAKRETSHDRPLFLDDVVVSLDRNHRGMIVEVLEKEFSDRGGTGIDPRP